jgi:hypothetical protein
MQELFRVGSDHPLVAMAVAFVILLFLCFLFMKLVKLALILLLIAMVAAGFYFFQNPASQRPANLKEAVEKARTGTGKAVEKGRELVDKGKGAVEKGRDLVERGKDAVEKGRDLVERGKDAVEEGRGVLSWAKWLLEKGRGLVDRIGALWDRGIEKGNRIVGKGGEEGDVIGKILETESSGKK